MSDTPTDTDQAVMALKLEENVRELIRNELALALTDISFLSHINTSTLASVILMRHRSETEFRIAVKEALKQVLNNSY